MRSSRSRWQGPVAQDFLELGDQLDQVGVFVLDFLALETGQPGQPQVENGLGLLLAQGEAFDQAGARRVGRLAPLDELHDLVDVVQRDAIAFEDVRPRLRLAQVVLGAPHHDLLAEGEVLAHGLLERHHLGPVVH